MLSGSSAESIVGDGFETQDDTAERGFNVPASSQSCGPMIREGGIWSIANFQ